MPQSLKTSPEHAEHSLPMEVSAHTLESLTLCHHVILLTPVWWQSFYNYGAENTDQLVAKLESDFQAELGKRIVKLSNVMVILLYGAENWMLTNQLFAKLESFQAELGKIFLKLTANEAPLVALHWPTMKCADIPCTYFSNVIFSFFMKFLISANDFQGCLRRAWFTF